MRLIVVFSYGMSFISSVEYDVKFSVAVRYHLKKRLDLTSRIINFVDYTRLLSEHKTTVSRRCLLIKVEN